MADTKTSTTNGLNSTLAKRSEVLLYIATLAVIVILVVPLPPMLLDLLLALNIALSLLLLLVTLAATRALDFSIFPSLLLLLTLFRLALNVATTRLVLIDGSAGSVVSAFGNFVVGGNLVVGLVVFLILVVIQFVVITKGATRISEVTARFVLDALPGKQVAIDAELNAGTIDEVEATSRRQALHRETEFYGAMDGAGKFVRGDAVASLIITAVNLIAGFIMGVSRNMGIAQSFRTYSILTIGDGLVSQIPALIIATASGMLVTKASTQSTLGSEIGTQVAANPRPLLVCAVILLGLSLLPGLPFLPFMAMAGILFFVYRRFSHRPAVSVPPEGTPSLPGQTGGPAVSAELTPEEFLQTDRITLEMGARLVPLVEPRRGLGLKDRISGLRRDLAQKMGVWVPPIRVRDNNQIDLSIYRLLIDGREVARGQLQPDSLLAINPSGGPFILTGDPAREPAFGLPALWIQESDRQRGEMAGYTVVEPLGVLITHLGEAVRKYAHELLSRKDLGILVDKVRQTSSAVVDELIPNALSLGGLHRIVCILLEEQLPLANLPRILESLSAHIGQTKEPIELAERVRGDLGRVLCDPYRDEQGRLHAIVLDPHLEMDLRRSMHERKLVLEPARLEKLITSLANEWRKALATDRPVALLTDASIRRPLRHVLLRALPDLQVLAYQEVPNDLLLEPFAIVKSERITTGAGTTATNARSVA